MLSLQVLWLLLLRSPLYLPLLLRDACVTSCECASTRRNAFSLPRPDRSASVRVARPSA